MALDGVYNNNMRTIERGFYCFHSILQISGAIVSYMNDKLDRVIVRVNLRR